jgi:hypothetical protein
MSPYSNAGDGLTLVMAGVSGLADGVALAAVVGLAVGVGDGVGVVSPLAGVKSAANATSAAVAAVRVRSVRALVCMGNPLRAW